MIRLRNLALGATLAGLALGGAFGGHAFASSSSSGPVNTHVLHPDLPFRSVAPALLPNAKENTSVIAQNNGNANATIAMDIYTTEGVLIPAASRVETNVPPGGTRTFAQAINSGLFVGFRGVGVLSSDQPINALLVRDIEENGTGRKSYSVHNAYGTGGNVVTLPYISNNAGGVYQTRFAIANTGTATACVTILYAFDPVLSGGGSHNDAPTGQSGCASGYPIPVGGQIAFGPFANAAEATRAMPAATAGKIMSATVTSTGAPVTVGVDAYVTSGERKLASYDGFIFGGASSSTDDLGTSILIPLAAKIGGFYTQILVSNPNATQANITITYSGSPGGPYPVQLTVPANGSGNHSVYAPGSPIPENFVGSAVITSNVPVAAVLFRVKMTGPGTFIDEDLYTAINGVPADRATTTAKLPLLFRRIGAGGGLFGYNTWFSVAVADGTSANVTVNLVTDTTNTPASCGAAATYTTSRTVDNSYIFYQNIDQGAENNGIGANPACGWFGGTITSNKPIVVIANVTNDIFVGDNDGLYNAFGN
jgi:hypothetical protein